MTHSTSPAMAKATAAHRRRATLLGRFGGGAVVLAVGLSLELAILYVASSTLTGYTGPGFGRGAPDSARLSDLIALGRSPALTTTLLGLAAAAFAVRPITAAAFLCAARGDRIGAALLRGLRRAPRLVFGSALLWLMFCLVSAGLAFGGVAAYAGAQRVTSAWAADIALALGFGAFALAWGVFRSARV